MADTWNMTTTPTKSYDFVKPEPGASAASWGTKNNSNFDQVADCFTDHQTQITARVKLAGDTMTGSLTFQGDGKGIVLHRDSKIFDVDDSFRIQANMDNFRLYTEDGSTLMLEVTPTAFKHAGAQVLTTAVFKPDENYVPVTGGTFKGGITVVGDLKATTFGIGSNFSIYTTGPSTVFNYGDNDYEYFNRDANAKLWVINGANAASLDGDGNFFARGNVTAFSDRTLKENIVPSRGLEAVLKMNGVSFDYIPSGKRSSGVIAQDLREVAPELIILDPTSGKLAVNYAGLPAYFIEAIKELKAEIDELKKKLSEK